MAVNVTAALRAELEQGRTLPASWYSDPAVHRIEQERIFRRAWQYAGEAGQAAEPGQFFTCQAGDLPVVVVRGDDGTLRAFVNVCRHRGHLVAEGCGRRETLQCPYHAWTYRLDGTLRAAPRSDREPGFELADWALHPVRVETWGPLVFVNPDPAAAPLADTLGSLPASLAERGLDPSALEFRGRGRDWVIEANWKIVVENFLECYHCPVAHKSFSRLIDVDPDTYRLTTERWTSSQYGPVNDPGANGKELPYDLGGEIQASQFHFVWPNWTLNTLPGPPNLRVLVFRPLDPDRTVSWVDGFWAPGTSDEVIDEINAFGNVVGTEDVDLVQSVHRGLKSGMVPQGRLLLDSELLIQHFQLLVHDALATS
jgi:phenylpropionate dioxygenase-like ring-hydroxylating dioxygenase large terminal subunit